VGPAQAAARAVAALPFLPAAQWVEAARRPAIMDTTRARQELHWVPRFTALEALQGRSAPRKPGQQRGNRDPQPWHWARHHLHELPGHDD
jgi:hypothetical protein